MRTGHFFFHWFFCRKETDKFFIDIIMPQKLITHKFRVQIYASTVRDIRKTRPRKNASTARPSLRLLHTHWIPDPTIAAVHCDEFIIYLNYHDSQRNGYGTYAFTDNCIYFSYKFSSPTWHSSLYKVFSAQTNCFSVLTCNNYQYLRKKYLSAN